MHFYIYNTPATYIIMWWVVVQHQQAEGKKMLDPKMRVVFFPSFVCFSLLMTQQKSLGVVAFAIGI
jgi:hypothetical protein